MCHLALEKALKAIVTEETRQLPARTHNLIDLARRTNVSFSPGHRDFLGKINDASVVMRYPDDLSRTLSQYSADVARDYLEKTKEVIAWLRQDPRLQPS